MEFKIEGRSVITLEHQKGDTTSTHVKTDFNLNVSKGLDSSKYFDEDNLPNEIGCKALTQTFVQGLVGNIHHAHEKKYWNDVKHLEYIIAELTKGFATVAKTFPSNFD